MKIKLPKIFPAKPKKLRATAVRKPLRIAATADYDEMAEPNMKLSRALLIVLVLHVVAVSGIIAFNAIKTHQNSVLPSVPLKMTSPAGHATTDKPDPTAHTMANAKEAPAHADTKSARASAKATTKEERKGEHAKASGTGDSGKVYVVAKGDNPVAIAKKLKVPYDDLLSINHIDDPHKLQIGQKLVIPSKPPKAKKVEE